MLTRILSLNIISFGKCCYRSLTDSLTKYVLPFLPFKMLKYSWLTSSVTAAPVDPTRGPGRFWSSPRLAAGTSPGGCVAAGTRAASVWPCRRTSPRWSATASRATWWTSTSPAAMVSPGSWQQWSLYPSLSLDLPVIILILLVIGCIVVAAIIGLLCMCLCKY